MRRWDYMPSPDKKLTGTWDNYQNLNGFTLSTEHQFDGKRIYFTELRISD